jgi:2-keto-4-pentenoate hydratase
LAIEAEMAIEIDENDKIISVYPIIELHNFVFRAPKKSLSELIANNGLNNGIIISNKNWRALPEAYNESSLLTLEVNGSVIDSGELWPMKGGPKSSINWLKNHLSNHDLKMTSEHIILGGTALGLHKVQPGDCVEVKVDGKTAVRCFIKANVTD